MNILGKPSIRQPEKELSQTEQYLNQRGVTRDAIAIAPTADDPLEEYFERHSLHEDALRTNEGRKGAELKHRLIARMIVLSALITPMVVIPLWLMWVLSPPNAKHYSERMQAAFLAALATNALGLCWVVTRDLFPQAGKDLGPENEDFEDL